MGSFEGVLLAALVIASTVVLAAPLLSSGLVYAALTQHAPIYIDGNAGFTSANGVVSGLGTKNDPYIIENWEISAENSIGIFVTNTTARFIIRNCYVHDGKSNYKDGIFFYNVINGKIENNIVENTSLGILLDNADNNLISNDLFENNGTGILLSHSNNNLVENNIASGNSHGFVLEGSNNLISNNIARANSIGVTFLGSNNFILNNIIENNEGYGIELTGGSNNNFSNNIVRNNHNDGIFLHHSENNIVSNNIFENNSYYGIELDHYASTRGNQIYHNNFINNGNQAYDSGSNYWDNGYPSGGNYWSDYTGLDTDGDGIGDTQYVISGDNNQDRYPLMKPFGEAQPAPFGERNWSLIAGIVGVIAIIGVGLAIYLRVVKDDGRAGAGG